MSISGKLTTQRARSETYRQGYLLKVGDQVKKQIQTSTAHCQLKPGLFGVRVSIMPPNFDFVDRPSIKRVAPTTDTETKPVEEKKVEQLEKGDEVKNANSEKAGNQTTTA